MDVVAEITRLIQELPPGSRLPSYRDLQKRYRLGPQTVRQAIAVLVSRGLVVTHPGQGSFTASARRTAAATAGDPGWQTVVLGSRPRLSRELAHLIQPAAPGVLPLANSYLDETLQPAGLLASAAARAARHPLTWGRQPVEGSPELRACFAREIGGGVRADHVLIAPGGQAALTAAFRYLAEPGDPVVLESPTYGGAVAAARAAGLRPLPTPADRDGVLPDALSYALDRTGARLIYLQTRHANPTGATLAEDRRQAVLDAAARARAFVIEDDWVRDLDLASALPAPLAARDPDGHVVYVRSLTKPVAAGLRVAALIARGPAFERLRLGLTSDNLFVAPILQQTALDVLTAPGWPRHLARVRSALRERRDALFAALARHAHSPEAIPAGGVLAWLRLPDGVAATPLAAACRERGLAVEPGDWYFPGEPPGPFVRLSYAAAEPAVMEPAAAILAAATRDLLT